MLKIFLSAILLSALITIGQSGERECYDEVIKKCPTSDETDFKFKNGSYKFDRLMCCWLTMNKDCIQKESKECKIDATFKENLDFASGSECGKLNSTENEKITKESCEQSYTALTILGMSLLMFILTVIAVICCCCCFMFAIICCRCAIANRQPNTRVVHA